MNCRTAERLLSAERDGALATNERADLDAHVTQCADCRQMRAAVAGVIAGWQKATARVAVPDAERAWQDIHREIRSARSDEKRGRHTLWRWALPLGAAAALAVAAIIVPRWTGESAPMIAAASPRQTARADFVEVSKEASSVVYVDDKSGWLVVWAVDDARPKKF